MADPIYTAASPIAVNPTDGELIGGAVFTVHAPDDSSFSTPLAVTDPISGAAITPLRSNVNGTLPAFKVPGNLSRVILKSGAFVTELVSLGGLVGDQVDAAGLDSATVAAAIAAGGSASSAAAAASVSASAAGTSATAAAAAASAVAGVVATNDGIMTTVAQDSDSSFSNELRASFAGAFSDTVIGYDGDGNVDSVTDNGIETTFTYNANGTVDTDTRLGKTRQYTYDTNGNLTNIEEI